MDEHQEQKSVQLRALLAFALSAAVLFLYQQFAVKPTPRPPAEMPKAAKEAPPPAASAPAPAVAAVVTAAAPVVGAAQEQTFIVETDTCLVTLSNRGAVATNWTLKRYKNESGGPLELVNTAAVAEAGYPLSIAPREKALPADVNAALFSAEPSPAASSRKLAAPITLRFRWSDGAVEARKTFRFTKNSYLVEIESSLRHNGAPVPHFLAWRGGFGDAALADAAKEVKTFYFDPAQGKVIRLGADAAEKGPVRNAGNYLFAGVQDLYFAAVFQPALAATTLELETSRLETATSREKKKQFFAGAAVGGAGENKFSAYIGPKSLAELRAVRQELGQLVDFGFFGFIAYPLFLGLNWTSQWVSFGWAIILVTIVINFALFPLKLKSMQSMKKMQKLQPLIKNINDKYKGMSMRDPKRQQQNQEVMALYSKYGVNPMGGCLPMVLQLPFFFAFYTVLTASIEMRHASWLWVRDLSTPEHLPIHILPILMIATQFWYQKMTPTTVGDPAQQKMMQFMPLIMGFFFYSLSSGLVLYWLTGNLVGIAQQLFINRLPEPAMEADKGKKGRHKGKAGQ
jgi:YidC/Oxa1 family membrane protein insertase